MKQLISSVVIATLLGGNLAVPSIAWADPLPECLTLPDPYVAECTGPREPTGPDTIPLVEPPAPIILEATPTEVPPVEEPNPGQNVGQNVGQNTAQNIDQNVPPPAITVTNTETGSGSTNTAEANTQNNATINQDNNATITNTVNADLATGDNTLAHNTVIGDITTGTIRATVELMNFINSVAAVEGGTVTVADVADPNGDIHLDQLSPEMFNAVLAYFVGGIFDILAANQETGADSTNVAAANVENNLDATINHDAAIDNSVTIAADTGNNSVSNNTQAGNLTTGDIEATVTLVNIINSILSVPVLDVAILNIFGDFLNNIILPDWMFAGSPTVTPQISTTNANTGSNSTNAAEGNLTNNLDVDADLTATINNDVIVDANTGGNTVERNTVAGNVTTGAVDIQLTTEDIINQLPIIGDSWFLIFVNVMGEWVGQLLGLENVNGSVVVVNGPQITATNSNTGSDSTNTAEANVANNTDVDFTSNADINNTLNLDLNTGQNQVANNTMVGNITTGDITAIGTIVNIINQAINLNQRLFLGFVNIMGDWFGSIGPQSAFPAAVGGNPAGTSQAGDPPLPPPIVAGAVTSTDSTPPASPVRSRLSPLLASAGEIASGVSVRQNGSTALVSPTQLTPVAPEAQQAMDQAVSPWRMISLGLVALGIVLLLADSFVRRRRYNK